MNSLASYLARIHRSLSSREEFGVGLDMPFGLASHTLLERVLPIQDITATSSGLKQRTHK